MTNQAIREYLLGRLSSAAQTQFEEELTDDQVYEELTITEDELVDEYVRGELSTPDRRDFEAHFLASAEHQEKLRFAHTFRKYVTEETAAQQQPESASIADDHLLEGKPTKKSVFSFFPFRSPTLSYGLAAAILVVLVGAGWLLWNNLIGPGRGGAGTVLAVTLAPGLSRGDAADNRITVPVGTGTVRLQLFLTENRYQSYQATLLDSEDRTITSRANLKAESLNGQPALVLDVAANVIPAGDYRVKLNGVNADGSTESVAGYSFRIQTN